MSRSAKSKSRVFGCFAGKSPLFRQLPAFLASEPVVFGHGQGLGGGGQRLLENSEGLFQNCEGLVPNQENCAPMEKGFSDMNKGLPAAEKNFPRIEKPCSQTGKGRFGWKKSETMKQKNQ
jgi:hypothetical protein